MKSKIKVVLEYRKIILKNSKTFFLLFKIVLIEFFDATVVDLQYNTCQSHLIAKTKNFYWNLLIYIRIVTLKFIFNFFC